ncbi:class I SAM-dependent methyltransferase [Rhodopseudomonas palustris]|uniref:Class I SAM-dependent methyltransferase n=1 Tax=Rhodopseudomonas palustris TaxID=1076 RepID=A0AAX3DVP9_RHOPL|nr:class I SAM-dependent methyltransferase [Rhodopseudomonas palustris]MCD0421309.1 class I SAM-dependent methyltransferase [Rubrivivax sp. JA1024]UYO38921.1 class I SAM-dependent methyltransferase [Rhodopseudomonas palustris]UYO43643.1 class I SAM-dependent methyltransferase [Rhodopseudomonas palustris]
MGQEIDLLVNYPRTKRNVDERGQTKSEEDRAIARRFGKEFFDGDRRHGYGGFNYMPRFWQPVIPTFQQHFGLSASSSVLDVGCAKGFMLHDMAELIPGITVKGVDVSDYAIEHAIDDMKPHVSVASATKLPFADKSFDVVISINTVHNLVRDDCATALREIERVARKGAFITVDAYRDDEEKRRMMAWNLTAQTIMHVDEWKAFFAEIGYTGDYYWFIP